MNKVQSFEALVQVLRSDDRLTVFLSHTTLSHLYRSVVDDEEIGDTYVTSLLYRCAGPSKAFKPGLALFTSKAIYALDSEDIVRVSLVDISEWFEAVPGARRHAECVFLTSDGKALHLKVPRNGLHSLRDMCARLGLVEGLPQAVEDPDDVMFFLFRKELLHHLEDTEREWNHAVPKEVRSKYKSDPSLLTEWFLKKYWKGRDTL